MENINFKKDIENYKKTINSFFNNTFTGDKILMGKMPLVYYLYGTSFYNSNLYIRTNTINHILKRHKNISNDDLINLYENLINPLIIFSGSEKDTVVSILNYTNKNGYNIQVPIFFNFDENNLYINAVGTTYEQKTLFNYITKETLKHNLIAYNKKIENYVHTIGLLLPVEEDKFSIYDDTISYTLKNVKHINNSINYYKFFTENKYFKPEFKATMKELDKVLLELDLSKKHFFDLETMLPNYDENNLQYVNLINKRLIENKYKEITEYINKNNNNDKLKSAQSTKFDNIKFINENKIMKKI